MKINQFQFWSFFSKIPRLQPYFLAKNRSFSSLFNLQSKSINFNFGHFSAKYQGYSLTFWPKIAHFHHFSICNQNQSMSILVIFPQNTKVIALLFGQKSLIFITFQSAIKINQFQCWSFVGKIPRLQPYFLARNRSFSSLFNLQSKSINFNFGHLSAKYQGDSLTFGQISLIFITFQSAIKINQFQFWSFFGKIPRLQPYFLAKQRSFSSLFNLQSKSINFNFGHLSAKYQGYSLTFWPKSLIFITFQSAININQCQFWSFFGKIPRLQPYFLAKNRSFSSIFNLQSKSINFNFGHLSAKYQGYSLTFWPEIAHFHHFSICNQNQSISILVIFRQNTKVIALLFGQKSLIFITFQSAIKINQCQFWSFFGKMPRLQPYILARNRSFSSLFNLQSKSINFNFGHFSAKYQGYSLTFWPKIANFHHFSICNQNQSISILVICRQNTRVIALLFGQTSLIFITLQSAIKINQFQFWSFFGKIPRLQPYFLAKNRSFSSLFNLQSKSINFNFGHFSAKYQGSSLTFWPEIAHFHHFSICNQNQSISILVICRQNTKVIALLFGQKSLIFITFQSAIKINQFQFWSFFGKIPRLQPYILAKNRSFSSLFNLQSKSINFNFCHFSAKYQGYSLTFWPKIAHFHHFSICNQNQSMSILVIFRQNIKAIALLFGQNSLIFITFQSAIKINQFQFWSFFGKIPRLQPYFLAKNRSFSSLFNLQSKSINFNFGHFSAKYQGYSLTFWPKIAHFHHFSICNQNQSISILVIFRQNTKAIALHFGQKSLIFITFQSAIKINQFQFWSFYGKLPRLQPYFLAKHRSFSSLFNLQSKSINFTFGHFLANYQGYSLTFWPNIAHFHHFSICNQNQSISILVIFRQNTKIIALPFGQKSLIFITFQSAIKINQFQFWSFVGKIPRLQPYFLAKNRSFSSLFNLQSKSINFNFGHLSANYQGYSLTFWPKIAHFHHFSIRNQNQSISILVIFRQNTKFIALLFGQKSLIFITFQSAIKINQFQFWSFVGKIPRLQPYFWPNIAHFHHFSICNQNQSISILVIFRQNTKVIALLFGQKSLIFITFQSAIKINQFQFWSFFGKIPRLQPYFLAKHRSFSSLFNLQSKSINFNFGHLSAKYQGYSLTFWPKIAHFHHFSICNQIQSISILVIFRQTTKVIALLFGQKSLIFITFQSAIKINQFQFWSFFGKIPRLQPYFLAKYRSFSSLFNLQSKSINFNFGHLSAKYQSYSLSFRQKIANLSSLFNLQSKSINFNFCHFSAKYQGYSLTFWPKIAHFHHFSICNQNQSISILVIFRQNTKVIALHFGQKSLIFITFQSAIKINQFQFWSFFGKIPRLQPYFLPKNRSFSSLFNLQSKSINFNFGHFSAKYQGYSLTFWPKIAHFHHFSICNQNQSISILVIFRQNTKVIALLFGQISLIFITFQSAIKINQFQFVSFFGKIPRLQPYILAKNRSFSSLFNLQSKSINFNFGHFSAKYQGYSLTFCPKIAHFHHFSICNQNQSISILVIFRQNTKVIALHFGQKSLIFITFQSAIKINQFQFWSFFGKIPRLQPYFLAKYRSFSSLFNLQSKSINFNLCHFSAKYQGYSLTFWPKIAHFHHFSICNQNQSISILVIFRQNTNVIALLFGQKSLIFITFQSAIKINQFQFWSFVGKIPMLQPYFLAKNRSFSSLFNLQSKSINFNFGHFSAKYQGYSLTFWPKIAHFHHFSICNQNQSISILVIFRQNTKVIALLFGQISLIFITFQSAIKINQFQFVSFFGKIPRLQPYILAKNRSFSSLFNLQSKSINFNFGHFSAKYQRYSLTFWPKIAHFHHFSICTQNQSISILVICRQNTNVIALLFGQKSLIFITFQSAININQFQFWSFFGKIPRLQPYFLAKNRSFSSLFNLQSKSINFNFGHFSAKYQGYSLTFWPKIAHFHHFSICNQNQSISILVICRQNAKVIALLFGQISLILPTSLFNLQSKSINFNLCHFSAKYQGYSLTFWPKIAHFHHFSICNQNQSISILVIFRQNTNVIALLFGQKSLIFITFQSAIKINQFFNFGHLSAKYQCYSLTFWPKIAHFHHFSICNQHQSISILVIFRQNTKVIALLFGQKSLIFITFQSAIKINQFQFWSFFGKIPRLF